MESKPIKEDYSATKESRTDMATVTNPSTTTGSTTSSNGHKDRWGTNKNATNQEIFKGSNPSLKGKVFTIGPMQASRYDETLKAILGYVADKFDNRVHISLQHKKISAGKNLLSKPVAPTKQDPADNTRKILDKDGEEWVEYSMKLKRYIDKLGKLEDDLQQAHTTSSLANAPQQWCRFC